MLELAATVIVTGLVLGLLCWLVVTFIPMDARFKNLITGVVIVLFVLWVIALLFGITTLPFHLHR